MITKIYRALAVRKEDETDQLFATNNHQGCYYDCKRYDEVDINGVILH